MYAPDPISSVYGHPGTKLSPTLAAFVNGVAVSIGPIQPLVTNSRTNGLVHRSHINRFVYTNSKLIM